MWDWGTVSCKALILSLGCYRRELLYAEAPLHPPPRESQIWLVYSGTQSSTFFKSPLCDFSVQLSLRATDLLGQRDRGTEETTFPDRSMCLRLCHSDLLEPESRLLGRSETLPLCGLYSPILIASRNLFSTSVQGLDIASVQGFWKGKKLCGWIMSWPWQSGRYFFLGIEQSIFYFIN